MLKLRRKLSLKKNDHFEKLTGQNMVETPSRRNTFISEKVFQIRTCSPLTVIHDQFSHRGRLSRVIRGHV